jgi:hypothetical protein
MNNSRAFLHITYKLYGHLDKLSGVKKIPCTKLLSIFNETRLEKKITMNVDLDIQLLLKILNFQE